MGGYRRSDGARRPADPEDLAALSARQEVASAPEATRRESRAPARLEIIAEEPPAEGVEFEFGEERLAARARRAGRCGAFPARRESAR